MLNHEELEGCRVVNGFGLCLDRRPALLRRTAWIWVSQGIVSLEVNWMEELNSYVLAQCFNSPFSG